MFFLMCVSLLPFSASFLSENLWSRVAMGFYIFNMLLILFFHTLHWFYSYRSGLVKLEGNEGNVIHKAIMKRARTAFIGYIIVGGCCFHSSYLALCATILMHIVFTFTGFIELLHSLARKKIKALRRNAALLGPKDPPEHVIEVKDIIEPSVKSTK